MKTVRPLGLYIHIPFCKAKCVYCDFYSLPHGEDRMDAYTEAAFFNAGTIDDVKRKAEELKKGGM